MTTGPATTFGMKRERIDIEQKYELRDWAICLDTPAEVIQEAVRVVGDRAETVVSYLQQRSVTPRR